MEPQNNRQNSIVLPELSLVVLVGASGSGKSTFAQRLFKPTEIVSSDWCRAAVSDDENSMEASADAFDLMHYLIGKRLKRGLLTVADATHVRKEDRAKLVALAREHHVLPTAIVLNLPQKLCTDRAGTRADRTLPPHVISSHIAQLKKGISKLKWEGFRRVYELRKPEEIDAIQTVIREPLWNNRKGETGPFDIVGDVHGCYEELCALLVALGHEVDVAGHRVQVSAGRKLVFVGDLVDRGPATPAVLKLVMNAVREGAALCVPGNHDAKLMRYLGGKNVTVAHGLQRSIEQLAGEPESFREDVRAFIDGLVSHYVLDGGKLVVAHAGLKETMQGRGSAAVREFCLFGETTGEIDEFGLPVRYNWAAEYKGKAAVVYGHTPVPDAQWLNNTIDIDTGCVFGGSLTALRWPERELVSVPAQEVYCEPARPLLPPPAVTLPFGEGRGGAAQTLQHAHDELPDLADIVGKQVIDTTLAGAVTIREGNAAAALEVMSRFALRPKWLIYLPPTMSPAETSPLPDYLEHPAEAFSYYRKAGLTEVVCQEKHMGSRAVVIVCKDVEVVKQRFGLDEDVLGTVYTRTGRRFFTDAQAEADFLGNIHQSLTGHGFWENFETDWVCLDAELMPWSAKAQALLQHQYAAVGSAATQALHEAVDALAKTAAYNPDAAPLLESYKYREAASHDFVAAYRRYCWDVKSVHDYKLAPFHLLATEGRTYFDKDHRWHMDALGALAGGPESIWMATAHRVVHLEDEASVATGTAWWEDLTARGGEGMVVKPMEFFPRGKKGLWQPAIKIRGREYLRIIYGPEYTRPENMARLKSRGLSAKRSLAIREAALGAEALERFVRKEPLRRVHPCVFGVLALESEAVDPRL